MADALLSALASTILTNLNSLALGEFATAGGLTSDLHNLESTFTTIQAVLHDAEEKQWKDEAVKNWLRKLKDTAYEVDDLLDEFAIHAQRRRLPKTMTTHVRSFFSDQNPLVLRVNMAQKLKSIIEKLDAIASEKHKFHLIEEVIGDREGGILDWRLTTSLVNESEIIGRNEEKEELINMVLANSDDHSVYAICGMGGLGKTTLAQLVYNDRRIERHFSFRIWVCVSDDFNLRRLIGAIIESIEGSTPNIQELDPLQRRMQEKLSGKKFLLVLDDVWNEDRDKWDGLKNAIRCGAAGSVVVVTTRNEKIALMMASGTVYRVEKLSDDGSWSLFQQRAFAFGRREEFVHLETIGRDIVKKCGGLPLAIKAMGSLMSLKRTESEWLSVRESEIWELPNEGSMNILPALRLSYNHLGPHLKQCFAFCSIFPKDYIMEKEKLIGFWMANNFISCQGQMDLYDRGQEIFGELVWRSFFQDLKEDFLGNTTCKMHDLVHDLAQSIMIDECKLIEPKKILEVPKMVRHLSIFANSNEYFSESSSHFKSQSLRSFLGLELGFLDQCEASYLSKQKRLRVLDLSGFYLEKLPLLINRLKHLRFLDLSYSSFQTLPESTTSLQNLQTLNLTSCHHLYKLPDGLKHMKSLLHLDISGCNSLTYMPAEVRQLTRLRKLSIFIVGKDKNCGIGELKELNLGGELTIKMLDYVEGCRDAMNANLIQKKDLKALTLWWSRGGEDYSNISEGVLEGLQPNSNIKKLEIHYYKGFNFPNWLMDLILPNLVEIKLDNCFRCEQLPPLGELKFLKHLIIAGMDGIKRIRNEICGNAETSFPSLESFSLENMKGLKEWGMVSGGEHFPVLRYLSVDHCPKLGELLVIPSVRELDIVEGSEMLVKSIGNFTSVTKLFISDYRGVTHLPDGLLQGLTLLEELQICLVSNVMSMVNQLAELHTLKILNLQGCEELKSFPEVFWRLSSLETLDIGACGIKSFPPINGFHGLSSLRKLNFQNCKEFEFLTEGMGHLAALEDLLINGSPKLNSLPESITHLTALRELRIWHLEGLSFLPNQIGNLKSLSYFGIRVCPNLMCLPEGICNLKMLRELRIEYCPTLRRRCQEDRGEDWPKIAHIPVVRFEDRQPVGGCSLCCSGIV